MNKFPMLRFFKLICLLACAVAIVPRAQAFVLGGPNNEPYQVPVDGFFLPFDLTGPKNIGEGYRRTAPTNYYSYDQNFLNFFGSNGVAAVDQAFSIYNSVGNFSQYSPDLSEFPLEAQRANYTAESLSLLDLRSTVMGALTEQLGLDQPVRYVWCLHNRFVPAGNPPCPAGDVYTVIQRNFDLLPSALNQFQYSSYVNGTLYSYVIEERCTGANPLADAVEFAVDPLANQFTAVADYFSAQYFGLTVGSFYTYLTRDDVGGLRYLMGTNNYNFENSGPGTVQLITNNTPQILTTLDLGSLLAQASTNSAAQLQALFPGLIVTDTTNYFKVVNTPVISLVVTSSPFSPAGFVQVVAVTNFVPSVVQFFGHSYGNIITNFFSRQSVYSIQTTVPGAPFSPAGSPPVLVTTTKNIRTSSPAGDFFLLPPGLCGIKILNSNLLQTVVATTNAVFSSTNSTAGGTSNQTFTVNIVTYFTNHVIVYLPVTCPADTVAMRQGMDHVYFVRRDFDSLLGQFFTPITNTYTRVALTNSALVSQTFQRVVNRPDFLFSAADLDSGPNNQANLALTFTRNLNMNQANRLPGLAGPGTLESPTTITFNKSTPIYLNLPTLAGHGFLLTELTHAPLLVFGSFDATTNDPIVYPNGTSLANLQNMLVIQVLPQTNALPAGKVGVAYSFNSFSATGGQAPYAWSLSPVTPGGLPGGFNPVDPATGALSGTPTTRGTYDFIVRLTDAGSRFVDVPYSITINP